MATTALAKNPNKRKADNDDIAEGNTKKVKTTTKATAPRPRKSAAKTTRALPIGRSYEECAEWDKKLIDMRDAGDGWEKIRKEWQRLTGEKAVGRSTLPNRYLRLKSNFTVIKEHDNAILIAAKQEIEDEFDEGKWANIAARMQDKGTDAYLPEVLYIQYKKLMLSAEYLPEARQFTAKKNRWEEEIDATEADWESGDDDDDDE